MGAEGADFACVLSLGRSTDPLIESILASEGYRIKSATEPSKAFDSEDSEACAAALFLLGGSAANSQVEAILSDVATAAPNAKLIVAADSPFAKPATGPINEMSADRLLWLDGSPASPKNLERIRRFLRGEAYHWASDLGTMPNEEAALLESADRYDESQRGKFRNILRFAGDLGHFTEVRPMLDDALRRILSIMECDAGSIYIWDDGNGALILESAQGPDQDKRVGLRQKLGEGLAGWVAEVGESILVSDSRKVQRLGGRTCTRYSKFGCIATPVSQGGQLFGVVCVTMPHGEKTLGPQDLRIAQLLAQKLATVIRPLSVLSELRRFSDRLMGAFQTSSRMEMKKDEQVESLRAQSANILESIPLAVIAYDKDLKIRSANRLARSAFGVKTDETGAPLESGVELDKVMWRNRLRSVVDKARKFRLQRVPFRTDSISMMLDIHCSPLTDPEGKAVGGILTIQDVTDDLEMEAKLSSAERLALIGQLAAKVAHELNNPLDGILRFLNLAVKQINDPEKAKSYLDESRNGLLRMSNILAELLAFSRSHRGNLAPASLSQVIRQSIVPYEQRAKESKIELIMDIPQDLPESPGPEVWEVVSNLVKNALDAVGEKGKITVRVAQEGNLVRLTVADTGPGVPPELREKIFEPFFTTKKTSQGTGLGLALCRDSLRRIGGTIQLLPTTKGATFEVTIPVRQSTEIA